jgi:hypothetical protein
MKYFKRHPPISLHEPDGTRVASILPLSMEDYFNLHILNDKRFSPAEGFKAVMAGGRIQVALQGKSAEVALEDAEYEIVKAVIETPNQVAGNPLSPEMGRQYLPHPQAILSSSDRPAKKESKKAAKKAAKKASAEPGKKAHDAEAMN